MARNLYIKKKVAPWRVRRGSYDSNGIVDTLCTKNPLGSYTLPGNYCPGCELVHVFASQMSSEPLCRSQKAQTGGLSNRVTHERFHSSSLFTGDKGPGRVTHCNAHKWTHMISICKNVHVTKSIHATAER